MGGGRTGRDWHPEPREMHLSVRLLRLGLLTRPFDTAPLIDRRWRLWRGLLLPHFLNPLPRQLVEAVIQLYQELGQRPHQRIDTVWRVACPNPIEITRESAHLVFQLG